MAHVLLADELGGGRREQQIIAFRTRRQREASHRCTGLRVDLPAHGVLHRAIPSASLESRTDRVSPVGLPARSCFPRTLEPYACCLATAWRVCEVFLKLVVSQIERPRLQKVVWTPAPQRLFAATQHVTAR